ncbi:MAG: hypothetical protein Q8N51_19980 [Gammaproteobacteria bacterium]|nr:hypothetical protein [Gammaproteobacteria bacterium]
MIRLRPLSRCPARAQDIAPEVKLTFLRDFLDATGGNTAVTDGLTAIIPLFVNKDPSNPAPE